MTSFLVLIIGAWLGCTVLVDFFVVPTVIKMVDQFFKAGDIGIALFSKFNKIELILGSILVALSALQLRSSKKWLNPFIMALILWIIAMTYLFWLSPKITFLTELWKKADEFGVTGLAGIPDLQQEHQWYHRLYIIIDSMKLLTLVSLFGLVVWKEKK